jgi:CHASE2 domain-containing sensor protein
MKKKHILKESFIATLIVLIITYLISFIPLSLEYGKALHQGFADFDIYDLHYADKATFNNNRDSDIVLVEIEDNRTSIAGQINLLLKYKPKVIALDAFFEQTKEEDSAFRNAVNNQQNLIFSYKILDSDKIVPNIFCKDNNRCGYGNYNGNEFSVIRMYSPYVNINGKQYDAITTSIIRMFNKHLYENLMSRNEEHQLINYSGNLENYLTISKEALKEYDTSGQLENPIRNKIVLLGFFVQQNDKKQPPLILEDLHFTPLNKQVSGKSYPDMYGVVIHANILSMILNEKYATLASKGVSYFLTFLIAFCFNYYLISRFHKKPHPHHAVFLLVQFLSILVILYFFLLLFNWFSYKVPLEPVMITMVLSLEMLGLYKSLALWLNVKYNYQTVFRHKRII